MGHVVLLGDSILDNGAYVEGGEPVVEQLKGRLPKGWKVSLLAKDGAVTIGAMGQIERLPADATHVVVSAGGNDALESLHVLNAPDRDSAVLLEELAGVQRRFQADYRRLVRALVDTGLPTVACTVYDAVPGLQDVERMALSLFNDVILRELIAARLPVLDLRRVCDEPRDYSSISPIEPSEIGGSKLSRALQSILLHHDFSQRLTVVYP